ncbi:MAG: oligosaccharide flippase family protein, partial [Leptotrichiaceae bacterium]|nr:oligosaccharide flippase family protein [Leptotrichiaceae bacterium]
MDSKNLLKGTMVYSLMNIVTKMGSLIFLPIITRLLTPEEFGVAGTLDSITTMATIILGLGIYNAQMKKYVDLKEDENEMGSYMFSSFSVIMLFNGALFIFLMTPAAKRLFSYIVNLDRIAYSPLITTAIIIAAVNALNTLGTTLFRMKRMYVKVALGSTLSLFSNYILAIYFIKYLKMGVFGNQIANLGSSLLILLYYFRGYFGKFKLKLKTEHMKYSVKNGIPLIFIELTDQVVNLSDRLVLTNFVSLGVVGGYTLAASGGRAFSVIKGSFVDSWTPEFYEAMKKDKNNPKITGSIENFIAIISFVCVLAQLFAPEGISLVFPKNYLKAINYMPLILAGIVVQALYCLDYFFHFHEDSIYIFYFTVFAMIFNLAGNLIFIPRFPEAGPIIAAWTTLLAFLFRAVMEMAVIRKKYGITFNYGKLILYLFIIVNPIILYLSNDEITWTKFIMKVIYFAIVGKLIINKEVYDKIMNIIGKIKRKII